MIYTTVTPTPSAPASHRHIPISERISDALRATPRRQFTAPQIQACLGDATLKQVQNGLANIGRLPHLYPNVHRVTRGQYIYDETRVHRRWVSNGPRQPAARPVLEAKRPEEPSTIPSGVLVPVQDATVMRDRDGRLYVVFATPVQ
jgi:hypothetical protein